LRFTLLTGSSPGNDMNLSLQRVEGNRNFTNKIWNATRFVIGKLEDTPDLALSVDQVKWTLADRWIRSRLNRTIQDVSRLFEAYQYGEAGRQLYDFFWSEFADWYIETAKGQMEEGEPAAYSAGRCLVQVLEQTLRMLHPFIPFVTEETWGYLKETASAALTLDTGWPEALIIAPWPETGPLDEAAEDDMEVIIELVRGIRNVRTEYKVQPGRRISALINGGDQTALLKAQRNIISLLARLDADQLSIQSHIDPPEQAASVVISGITCYLPLAGLIDLEAERQRLQKEHGQVIEMIARSERQLAGPFAEKAPAEVVQRERDKLSDLQQRRDQLVERLTALR
jgi:valyl-tRNA synthetase